jgi:hypothetical protein
MLRNLDVYKTPFHWYDDGMAYIYILPQNWHITTK